MTIKGELELPRGSHPCVPVGIFTNSPPKSYILRWRSLWTPNQLMSVINTAALWFLHCLWSFCSRDNLDLFLNADISTLPTCESVRASCSNLPLTHSWDFLVYNGREVTLSLEESKGCPEHSVFPSHKVQAALIYHWIFHFKKLLILINVDGGLKPKYFNEVINQEALTVFFKCPHTKLSCRIGFLWCCSACFRQAGALPAWILVSSTVHKQSGET